MMDLLTFIKDIGADSLSLFWLPLVIWTVLAMGAIVVFRTFKKIPSVYQYHGRVAIIWALPLGIFISYLLHRVSQLSDQSSAIAAKFIVISSPITVSSSASNPSLNWADPIFWLGMLTTIGIATALFGLLRLAINISSLKSLSQNIENTSNTKHHLLSAKNKTLLEEQCPNTTLLLSDEIDVPCTFGWRQKWVVVPASLSDNPEKLNIAVRHELMHICQSDYLLNATLQGIKALFYFHPLIHVLEKETEEYRELYCDQQVLVDPDISEKRYAELLFELSSKNIFRPTAAVRMAVHPSTLKKRIQVMKNRPQTLPPIKRSIAFMLITGLLFTGIMACSDMEEDGITNTEIEQAQSQMAPDKPSDKQPLLVLNGEKMDGRDSISRIKPKYIESINVLKGEKATAKYDDEGANGVIEITLIDKEAAFNDLRTDAEMQAMNEKLKQPRSPDKEDFYVAVEKQPEIIGGIKAFQENVTYPKECKDAKIEGRVVVQFIVNKQGDVEDPNIIRGIGGGCDEAALQAVKQTKFKPGQQRGKPVRVQMSLPVRFKQS